MKDFDLEEAKQAEADKYEKLFRESNVYPRLINELTGKATMGTRSAGEAARGPPK